nr:hypothetical protein [Tanacetum cinerariifolium]
MAYNRTMEELLQAPTEGYGEVIVILEINADHFEIKTNLLQLVQANPYHGFERENPHTHINNFKRITSTLKFRDVLNNGDDANRHIDKFLEITQHMKQRGVSDDALRLSLFPYSLTHHAIAWYDRLLRNSIYSFDGMMIKFLSKYFPPFMVTKLRNEITKFEQKRNESLLEACTGSLQRHTVPNPQEDLKVITTRSGVTLAGPSVSPPPLFEVDREPETITNQVLTGSTNNVLPLVV